MKKLLLSAALALGICGSANAGENPFLGEILTFAGTFCPQGYFPADGTLLAIRQNAALFSLLGTRYGGDGQNTFALPNIKPIFTQNRATLMSCIAVSGIFPSRP